MWSRSTRDVCCGRKIATAKLASPVKDALRRYAKLEAQRAKVQRRIAIGEVVTNDVVQLATERKHLTDVIVYEWNASGMQADCHLATRVSPDS